MKTFWCNGSAGQIIIEENGSGNSKETIITCKEGQFPETQFEIAADCFKLKIIGEFEIAELIEALAKYGKVIGGIGWTRNSDMPDD